MKWMWMHGIMNYELWMEMCDNTEIYENCDEMKEMKMHTMVIYVNLNGNMWKENEMNVNARHCELWEMNGNVWKLWWKWNEYECLILYFMTNNEKSEWEKICVCSKMANIK